MNESMMALLGVIGCVGLGIGVVCLIERAVRHLCSRSSDLAPTMLTAAEVCGLGIVLGIGLTSWLSFLWSLPGGRLGMPLSLGMTVTGCLLAAMTFRRRTQPSQPEIRTLASICRCAIGVIFIWTTGVALLTPQKLWDERAIFAIKGAVLAESHTIHAPALHDPDFVQGHPRYPLLIPLAEQHLAALIGAFDDRKVKLLFPVLYLGMVLTFAGNLSRQFGKNAGWMFALLLATVPALIPWEYGFLSAQADAPVAAYHGVSVLFLWEALRGLRRDESDRSQIATALVIAGLAGGLAAFTKDEGIAFLMVDAIAVCGCCLLIRHSRSLRSLAMIAIYAVTAGVVILPWFLYRSSLPATNEMSYFTRLSLDHLAAGGQRLKWSVWHLGQRMFIQARTWGLQWWGVVFAALTAPRIALQPAQLFLLLDIFGALAGLVVAGILAPLPVEDHLGGSSHRFLIQITPTAVLFLAACWGAPGATQASRDLPTRSA